MGHQFGSAHSLTFSPTATRVCARGMRNKEIARLANISEKTVKGHLNNIFRKLGVDSRFALGLHIMEPLKGLGPFLIPIWAQRPVLVHCSRAYLPGRAVEKT